MTPLTSIPRRTFLQTVGGVAAACSVWGGRALADAAPRRRVLRVAHLTDVHVQPELRAPEGMTACLRHVQSLPDKPDVILSGGDHIMDCFRNPYERAQVQWDLWKRLIRAENSLPIYSCIGNHDIFGWDKIKSRSTGNERGYGKQWAIDALGLPKSYYSFSRGGWHFVALDGVQPGATPGGYAAFLDDAQFDWLQRDLESVPRETPVLLWTHIPVVSALPPLMVERAAQTSDATVVAGNLHTDGPKVTALLARFPNVKLCLSGHLHRVEHVELRGIHYYCNGAVSGAWWKGKNDGFAEGYALLDLYDDGSHECRYVTYGWEAEV